MARKQPASTKKQPAKAAPAAKKAAPAAKTAPAVPAEPDVTEAAKTAAPAAETPAEAPAAKKTAKKPAPAKADKPAAKKAAARKTTAKKTKAAAPKEEPAVTEAAPAVTGENIPAPEAKPAAVEEKAVQPEANPAPAPVEETPAPVETEIQPEEVPAMETYYYDTPRRSIAFIGSECHPFVKTGGLGDVMYALPRELVKQNCDVRVILPRYACIPQQYQDKMVYRGEFYMDLGQTGRSYYVGIMEYVWDGVVYDFIDNQEFFSAGNPYISLVDDIPKYCYFSKAALAALNYMNWIPDIIHCHDWQAALVPVYLRTLFQGIRRWAAPRRC